MKVGVDTFGCDHGKSGIGLYLMSLLANFPQDDNVFLELFTIQIHVILISPGFPFPIQKFPK